MMRKGLMVVFVLLAGFIGFQIYATLTAYLNISDVPQDQIMGNPQGDLTVVEFMDYRCIYCRQVHPTITGAIERDGRIRYIVRPVVFVDQYSVAATKMMYAAAQQGRFIDMHEWLIKYEGEIDLGFINNTIEALNLDAEKFETDMRSEAANDYINENRSLFANVGGTATPTFIIGHKMFYTPEDRMPTQDNFMNMFEEARRLGLQ